MKNLKSNINGITLIALVVTIIILLILAGITLNIALSENGIITQATRARDESRGAKVDESIKLWETEKQANKLTGGTNKSNEEFLGELKNKKLLTEDEYQSLLNGEEITIGSRTISIEDKEAKTIVEAFKSGELKVGDYVNYQNPSSGTVTVGQEETGYSNEQTYKVDGNTTWRVLGLDEEGDNLLLISGSPIKRDTETEPERGPYLALGGAEAWFNGKETLNKICNIYKNDLADEVRSMTMEDVTRALRNNNK